MGSGKNISLLSLPATVGIASRLSKKLAGSTPTIVWLFRSSEIGFPITFGPAPNMRFQRPKERTTDGVLPGRSSSGMKTRSRSGFAPSIGSSDEETRVPSIRSGVRPVTLKLSPMAIAISSNT